jgi:flagellar motor switch protein FliG
MNYDAEFCQQIRVSEDEKRQSFALISEILALATRRGNIIAKLDEKAIKRFLKIIDIDDLTKTLKDMDGNAQIKIFNHLPDRGAWMLLEVIQQMDSIAHQEIIDAQTKFVAIMSELEDQGRI